MERGKPEGGVHGAALTTKYNAETENRIGAPQTFEFDCLACAFDRYRFLGIERGAQGTRYAVSECVECGAITERRLTPPDGGSR